MTRDAYLEARDALIAVRQVPGGELIACALHDALADTGSAAQMVSATREAQLLLAKADPLAALTSRLDRLEELGEQTLLAIGEEKGLRQWVERLHPRDWRGQWVDVGTPPGALLSRGIRGPAFASSMAHFSAGGITAELSPRTQTTDRFAEVWLNLRAGSKKVGMARIKLLPPRMDGTRAAELSNVVLDQAHQHQGFGGKFYQHLVGVLQKGGVDQLQVEAVGVGGYAWARAGFKWARDPVQQQQKLLEAAKKPETVKGRVVKESRWDRALRHVPSQLATEFERKANAGEFGAPGEMAAFGRDVTWTEPASGRHPERTTWLGRAVMLDGDWFGERDIAAGKA